MATLKPQADLGQRHVMSGKHAGAQSGEHAKGKVERPHEDSGGNCCETLRDGEFGDDPDCPRREVGADIAGQAADLLRIEAVQEKMSDDEIVDGGFSRPESQGVRLINPDAVRRPKGFRARLQQAKHGRALIDNIGLQLGVGGEQAGKKTSVAIAKNQRAARMAQLGDAVKAAAGKQRPKSEVFEPAIGARKMVEICVRHQRMKMSRTGVSRAASAAMRKWNALIPLAGYAWSRRARRMAEMLPAMQSPAATGWSA